MKNMFNRKKMNKGTFPILIKGRSKKLLLGILLADVMLCTACGTNSVNNADSPKDTGQIAADETNTDDADEADTNLLDTNTSDTNTSDTGTSGTESKSDGTDEAKEFLDRFADIEKQSEELKNSIDHDDLTQTEYNFKSHDLYTLWDDALHDLWKVLDQVLSREDMDMLAVKEQEWVEDRDQKIAEAGKEVAGGSMQPMVEDLTGADLTEKRVRELITYIQDSSDTVSSENNSEDSGQQDAQNDLFTVFLQDGGKAKVADHFEQDNRMIENVCQKGDTFDFAALKALLQEQEYLAGVEPQIECAYLNHPNRKAYALSLFYESSIEGFTQFYILSEKDGQLEINFALDGWSRRYPSINENGVIFDGGSNGAGSHESIIYVPDLNFTYQMLSKTDENAYGYSFYDSEGNPIQTVNDIMNEAAEGNPDAMNVLYSQVVIDGQTYYYFLGMDKITQDLVDDIDEIAKGHGFRFDGKASVDAAELLYAQKLGAEDIYSNQKMADWQTVE